MPSRIKDRNVWLINATILTVGVAYGMAISILAVYLDGRGYTESDIGALAAWFALGIVAFSMPAGTVIRKTSARRDAHRIDRRLRHRGRRFPPTSPTTSGLPPASAFLTALRRSGSGSAARRSFCRARGEKHKAFATTTYAIAIALGYMIGPFIATLMARWAPLEWAFFGAGILSILTSGFVAWRLDGDRGGVPMNSPFAGEHPEEGAPQTPILTLTWRIRRRVLARSPTATSKRPWFCSCRST